MITATERGLWESFFTQQDPQPPLYQLLLRFLMLFTSDQPAEWIVRGPALVGGVLCVMAAWWFARVLFSPFIAALTALGIAINPLMVYYAREARPYSLFTLAAALSMTFFYRVMKSGQRRDLIGYAVVTAVMCHLHYYAVFCIAAQVVFLIMDIVLSGSSRSRLKPVFMGFGAAAVLSLPAISLFLRLLSQGMPGAWWIAKPSPIEAPDTLGDLLGLRAVGVVCLIPLVSAFWLSRTPYDWSADGSDGAARDPGVGLDEGWWARRRAVIYAALWVGFGLFVPIAGSILYKPGFVMRYALPVTIPMLAMGLVYAYRLNRTVFILTVVALFGYTLPKAVSQTRPQPGMRELVATLHAQAKVTDRIRVADWKFSDDYINPEVYGMRYYGYEGSADLIPVKEFEDWLRSPDEKARVLPAGRTFMICFGSTVNPVRDYLSRRGRAFEIREFGRRSFLIDTLKLVRIEAQPTVPVSLSLPSQPVKSPSPVPLPDDVETSNDLENLTPRLSSPLPPATQPAPSTQPQQP